MKSLPINKQSSRIWLALATIALFTLAAEPVLAQDAQYWDNQYGTGAQLLGGVVVGTPGDLSATFYNPGWIGMNTQPAILLTTKALEYYNLTIKNALGEGFDPSSSSVGTSPGFIAGRFSRKNPGDLTVAYSYIERTRFEFNASGIRVDDDSTPPPDGSFWFSGEAFDNNKTSESWVGATLSRQVSDHLSWGVTPYIAYRSQNRRFQAMGQALDANEQFYHAYRVDDFRFWHIRLLAKLGLALDYSPLTMGITLTTPSLGLFGDGSIYYNRSSSGFTNPEDGWTDPYLAVNHQEDLNPDYRSPLSLAVGASYRMRQTTIHFTAEYFASQAPISILPADPFTSQATGETLEFNTVYDMRAVLNFGFGAEHKFTDTFTLYGGFRSDYSFLNPDSATQLVMAEWDLWHVSVGAAFDFLDIEFTTGLDLSFGNGTTERIMNFNRDGDSDVIGDFGTSGVRYRKIKLILGFNLPFVVE